MGESDAIAGPRLFLGNATLIGWLYVRQPQTMGAGHRRTVGSYRHRRLNDQIAESNRCWASCGT